MRRRRLKDGWPLIGEPESEFERVVRPIRQEQHDTRLAAMNVALQTWRWRRFAIDLRPRSQWGRGAPGLFFLGRFSVRWHR